MTNIINSNITPYFKATLSSPIANVTGDGTAYTCLFDTLSAGAGYNTSTGNFTAPRSGYYLFSITISATNVASAHTLSLIQLVTTFGTFSFSNLKLSNFKATSNNAIISAFVPAKMSLNDTASVLWTVSNGTKIVQFDSISSFNGVRIY